MGSSFPQLLGSTGGRLEANEVFGTEPKFRGREWIGAGEGAREGRKLLYPLHVQPTGAPLPLGRGDGGEPPR